MADDASNTSNAVPIQKAGALGHTRSEWRRRVLRDLGGNGVDPELSEEQIDGALQAALELWNRHRPCRQWFPFDIPSGQTIVISFFADEAHTKPASDEYIRRIIRVEFSPAPNSATILGPIALLGGYYFRWGMEGPRLFFEMQVAERTYERLTGSRADWYWNPSDRKLYISTPGRAQRIMALATREMKLEEVPYDQVSLFTQAAVAKAKYYLARTLGSKGPIKTGGGEIQTDANELRQESKEEWEKVENELKVSQMSYPPPGWIG
jgi:hypothetical protein